MSPVSLYPSNGSNRLLCWSDSTALVSRGDQKGGLQPATCSTSAPDFPHNCAHTGFLRPRGSPSPACRFSTFLLSGSQKRHLRHLLFFLKTAFENNPFKKEGLPSSGNGSFPRNFRDNLFLKTIYETSELNQAG